MGGKSMTQRRRLPGRLLDSFARRQLEVSVVPILAILVLNAGLPPRTSLRFLHPLHLPVRLCIGVLFPEHLSKFGQSINPTIHLENSPSKFLYISYVNPETGLCLKGADDAYLLVFWLLAWTALRESLMRYVGRPFARYLGAPDFRSIERFAEQGWSVAYYLWSFSAGVYIIWHSDYWTLKAEEIFGGYPHFALKPFVKFYYLVQISFWLQQLIVLNIEERRKDYYQMLAHHLITIFLVIASYATNFVRIGNVILATMDFSDILFSFAKMLRYVGFQTACDVAFGLFVVSWVLTRHIIFGYLIYLVACRTYDVIGPWRWEPAAGWFWSPASLTTFVIALVALQIILCFWGVAIARVTVRVLRGDEAADTRSDEEAEEEDEEEEHGGGVLANGGPVQATGALLNGERPESTARRRH